MPPPKLKMHRGTSSGKLKSIPKLQQPIPSTSQGNQSEDQREAQEKFELELAWCIQRLEETLNSGKLNQKQTDDAIKTMKILKSSSQPTVKKRQIMRQTFGDYRTKMAEDEKTYSISTNAFKFLPSSKFKKSYFVKKAAIIDGDKNFKFNFSIDNKMDDLSLEEKPEKAETATAPAKIELQPTNGSEFKFNFNIETDEMI
uniref:CSON001169 protein n=1 Tax=Culicoides sonorensis TaxID=179676 RepID=A0A336M2Z0_CULSO